MSIRFVAVCQWCGKRGATVSTMGSLPSGRPSIPGYCDGHPSGNPKAPHNPRWEQR